MKNKLFACTLAIALGAGLAAGSAAHAQDGAKAAEAAGCNKCHDIEKKKMGASYKSLAAKFKGNKDAEKAIVAKLKSGEGHPKAGASDADLTAAVKWILAM